MTTPPTPPDYLREIARQYFRDALIHNGALCLCKRCLRLVSLAGVDASGHCEECREEQNE